jgi:tetratricopeptide (TPR) repeat protein
VSARGTYARRSVLRVGAAFALLAGTALAIGCAEQTQAAKVRDDIATIKKETTAERLRQRGEASAAVGDMTRAEQYYVAALRAGGDERDLTKRLLIVCVSDGRFPVALEYSDAYLQRHPNDSEVRFAAASIYAAVGDHYHARVGLERVLQDHPDLAEAHYALGSVLREEADLVNADVHFREYLRLQPNGEYAEATRASLLKSVP